MPQQLMKEVENLPLNLQQEALNFIRYLRYKTEMQPKSEITDINEDNETKLVKLMEKMAERNTAFHTIKDPSAWQREIRQDRPLPCCWYI